MAGEPDWLDEGIGERIKYLREDVLDLTQEEFAEELGGVSRGAVGNWEISGGIKRQNIIRIVKRFGVSFEWLALNQGTPPLPKNGAPHSVNPNEPLPLRQATMRLKYAGAVQAGIYVMPNDETEHGEEWHTLPFPERYRHTQPYLLRVMGDSMDILFPEGTVLVCCDLALLKEDPIHEKRYIVRRYRADGWFESTVKEYRLDTEGRAWAWPRSTNPSYQKPWRLDAGRKGELIKVHARVVAVLKFD